MASSGIAVNTSIETLLQELEADRARALLLWYLEDAASESSTSAKIQALIDDVNKLDAKAAYQTLESLSNTDLVKFSVLNEFGERFSRTKACDFLIRATVERFEIQKETMF